MPDSYDIIPVSARSVIGGPPEIINLPQGRTVSEMLEFTGLQPYGLHVFVDDRLIEPWQYPIIRPMAGERVFICIVPQGGDDSNKLLRSVAMIGIMILAIYATGGTAAFGVVGGSTGFGAAAGLAVSIGGSLLVNALIPPTIPDEPQLTDQGSTAKTYSITGAGNRYLPFQSIPKTLGTDRVFPPYAAKPYTTIVANSQFVNMLFCLGRGPLDVSEEKLGETLLENYSNYEISYGTGKYPPDHFRHYTYLQEPLSILLDVDDTEGNKHAGLTATVQTTDGDVRWVQIEFYSPALYFASEFSGGTLQRVDVTVEVKYRVNGETEWSNFLFDWTHLTTSPNMRGSGNTLTMTGYTGTPSRYGIQYPMPAIETYDISIRRTNLVAWITEEDDIYSDALHDDLYWASLTSISKEVFSAPDDMEFVSLRIEATEQLNGAPDDFNVMVSAHHPVYSSSYTSNYIFHGINNGFAITNGVMTIDNKWINVKADPENFMRDDTGIIVQDDDLKYVSLEDTDWDISKSGLSVTGSTSLTIELRIRQRQYSIPLTNRLYWSTSSHGFSTSYYIEFTVTTVGTWETLTLDMSSPTVGGTDWTSNTITGLKLWFNTVDYGEHYDIDFLRIQDSVADGWTYKVTSNPAWIYADILTCTANHRAKALSTMDTTVLPAFAAFCTTNGYTYNNTVSGRSMRDLMRCVCAAGRGAWTINADGTYSVIYDNEQTNVYQVFSPRNTWGFSGHKPFIKMPHALRVSYRNKDDNYDLDEVLVYADGYDGDTATLFESMEFDSLNDFDLIWKFGRYQLAQAILRPENYQLNVDWEHLAAVRGNRVRMAHDIPMWGTGWARIKTVAIDGTDVTLTIDDIVTFEAAVSYAILIRVVTGQPIAVGVTNPGAGSTSTLSCSLAPASSALIATGDLLLFGESDGYYQDLIIKNVEPMDDLSAKLILVDYNPDIYDDETVYGTIPAYDSNITIPVNWEGLPPPLPIIDGIVSDDSVLLIQTNGVYISQIVVAYGFASAENTAPAAKVECQYRIADSNFLWKNAPDTAINDPTVNIQNVVDLAIYEIRIRTITYHGIPSQWVSTKHTVVGKSGPPPQVTGFLATLIDNQIELSWNASTARDIKGYELRYGQTTDDWDDATYIGRTAATSYRTPAIWSDSRQFLIKAFDTTGNYSETATAAEITILLPSISNLTTDVIDNNVLFKWTNVRGSLPIDYIELRKGSTFAGATVVGQKKGTFTTTFESTSGQYKYWLVPVDTAGNYGRESSITATVDQPPDYVLNRLWVDDFDTGSTTNIVVLADGTAIAPANDTETFDDYFTDNGYTCLQDAITDGCTYFIEPVPTTAEYSQEFNHGAVISGSMVTMDLDYTDYNGGATITEYLAEKELVGDSYSEGTDNPVFFTSFQYLRDRFTFASDGNTFCVLNQHQLRLDIKLKEDTGVGTVTVAATGVDITFGANFADITSIIVTPSGTAALIAVYDFVDAPNPTDFTVYLFDTDGVKTTGSFSWSAKGY